MIKGARFRSYAAYAVLTGRPFPPTEKHINKHVKHEKNNYIIDCTLRSKNRKKIIITMPFISKSHL